MPAHRLRELALEEMDQVARIHRAAFDERLPWLSGRHTPEADRTYFREHVYPACEVWGAEDDDALLCGFIAFRPDWVDHLYVLPTAQGRGTGSALLALAQERYAALSLWTFQRNLAARAFYEAKGFRLVQLTDGMGNGEHEPDALYQWSRTGAPGIDYDRAVNE
jgi:GNAT superfamily N-acetyltransferase